ncbi:MAG TPA: aminotransferase class V-fold PLP-dependent enzyme [Spirochaetia bacterium]|nr:aminotransferase class V-fold PLP-dependent enzyme [Spirochaetia bacterium]
MDEADDFLTSLLTQLKPYRHDLPAFTELPARGLARDQVLDILTGVAAREEKRWEQGYASGAVYHGDPGHIAFLNQAYAHHSQSNPLHADIWPSTTKFEAEIVAMTARMLGATDDDLSAPPDRQVCGTVSSGGTESILLAMKTYRDWAVRDRNIAHPKMVIPASAHAAFDKAAQYFAIDIVKVPVAADGRADVTALAGALDDHTAVVVASAPSFPHGAIDPVSEIAALARERGIGCHVDACLGGFVLPWAEKLGYPVPPFDFRVPGVTSMSCDTHKYGYAAKGTSVVLYRGHHLLHHQYYINTDWPGGFYLSPSFAGSRPGGLSAACWAALVSMGEAGYLDATDRILKAAARIKEGLRAIPELAMVGDPLWVIALTSSVLNIYQVMEEMGQLGWSLNGLQNPAAFHLALTLRHTRPGVPERFLGDLTRAVATVKANPDRRTGMAPIYGLAASAPAEVVRDILHFYLDTLYVP